jgi:hypothetical protein
MGDIFLDARVLKPIDKKHPKKTNEIFKWKIQKP